MEKFEEHKLRIVTAKSQADKAINSLKGILVGINIDNLINEKEVVELYDWVSSCQDLITRNPFNEFMTIIRQSLEQGIISKETIDDLFWLCQKYEGDNYYYDAITTDLQTLQGVCHGILSDGIINEKEVYDLEKWLEANDHLSTYYPYDEIRSLVASILSDKKVDEEEALILKAYFSQFVKLRNKDVADQIKTEIADINIFGLCTSNPQVTFPGKTFCVTGVLKRGSREQLKIDIEKLGGIPTENLTKKTDYLIVGDNGNPAWAFSCYGRKVEKALNMRKEGHTITLIHEFDFGDIIDDSL